MNESKVLRDPVHGYIHIDDPIIWDLLSCREVQRLRRIHQLGGAFMVYHGAEHSRFSHSVGVYEIARRMVSEVKGLKENITEQERIALLCAGLLHDIGHGPFSHFFETLSETDHEKMGCGLILYEYSDVNQILDKYDSDLKNQIVDILCHRHPNPVLNMIISSQLDADRMDYLLRDARYTGTQYGNYDLERILRTMRIRSRTLCIKESGKHAVEDYLMSRYQMFSQVYLHPDASSFELLISIFFERYREIRKDNPIQVFEPLFEGMTYEDFIRMDDYSFYYGFSQAQDSQDSVLRDLAARILNRKLFGWIENPTAEQIEKIKAKLKEAGLDERYYFKGQEEITEDYPYAEEHVPAVMVESKGSLQPLSAVSDAAKALLLMEDQKVHRVYFPKEIGMEYD
ncbi:MAG: HD domain-containing protein [Erysipelotrichaceae bacterium]|nr:HD domain-containing protein [Erysipelotrichaceae bacterium]